MPAPVPECSTCRFFDGGDNTCHVHPPQATADAAGTVTWSYPVVADDNLCSLRVPASYTRYVEAE